MSRWNSATERRTASEVVRRTPPRAAVKPIAIEAARMAKTMTQVEVAKKLKLSPATIGHYIAAVREEGIVL